MTTETPEFDFTVVERPEIQRRVDSAPNPFLSVVKEAWTAERGDDASAKGKAVEFTVKMGTATQVIKKNNGTTSEATAYPAVEKVLRQLRAAGKKADDGKGCSVRTSVNLNVAHNKPTKGTATVQFWTVPPIEKKTSQS